METRMDHFSTKNFLRHMGSTLQDISSKLRQFQRGDITYKVGESVGIKMGSTFLSDMPPFEEFKRRFKEIVENLMLGVVEDIDIKIPFLRETRFILSISRWTKGENEAYTPGHNVRENGAVGLCNFKSGFFSGVMRFYLKRENVTKEISCGEGDNRNGICQFEIVIP